MPRRVVDDLNSTQYGAVSAPYCVEFVRTWAIGDLDTTDGHAA
jgi:hypothetical protein